MKQSKTAGGTPNKALRPNTVNRAADPGVAIQKITRLSRLSSVMEPLESRTLMSVGTSPILPAPFVATGASAPMAAPQTPVNSTAKTAVKTGATVKTVAPAAPSGVVATGLSRSQIRLSWIDSTKSATGYAVFRSSDGVHFSQIARLSGGAANGFTDSGLTSGQAYKYEVQALSGNNSSAMSAAATGVTRLAAPSGLTAAVSSTAPLHLSWTNNDPSATGYLLLCSTTDSNFALLTRLSGGSTNSFNDLTTASLTKYYFQIEAISAAATSPPSNVASVTTPLAAPGGLSATVISPTSATIAWTSANPAAQSYAILRSSGGSSFTQVQTIAAGGAQSWIDTSLSSDTSYAYEVKAVRGGDISAPSNAASITTWLKAPTALTAASSSSGVVLHWTDQDSGATGYNILRSTNGTTFTAVGKLTGGTATTYTDSTVSSSHSYYYQVQAINLVSTSAPSAAAQVTMPVLAPSGLTANASASTIVLTWTDNDPFATGYNVLRSTNGTTFTALTTLSQATAESFTDTTITAGQQYYYQVQAISGTLSSVVSNIATATVATPTPAPTPATVTIATRYTNELVITLTGAADTLSVTQSGSTLTIVADGQSSTQSVPAGGLFIYTRGGTDSIRIDSSVSVQTTIETIAAGVDTISSSGSDVTVWDDSSDIFSGTGTVHTVSAFVGGVSMAMGASLPNPSDSGSVMAVNAPLWGLGPVPADVNQGDSGDCYFLSSLAAFANVKPMRLEQSAVDMGDGTYTVEYISNGSPEYVRVNNQLPTYGNGSYVYARPGASGSIWAAIMEKAYAFFRTGANTYASIGSGWMGDVYAALGISSTSSFTSGLTSASSLYTELSTALAAGEAVTMGTYGSPPDLVGNHAYTLISVSENSQGVPEFVVRNPWGVSGDSLENSQGYATLTFAQFVANYQDICVATS